jgi:hypothetical protein
VLANPLIDANPDFRVLLDDLGGRPLNLGIYRLFEQRLFDAARAFVASAFPAWHSKLVPFACDWMGRIYALDGSGRTVNDETSLCLLDPATRDLLDVPTSVSGFHDELLVSEPELPLEEALWRTWLSERPRGLSYQEIAGWRRPAFLGGQLVVDNLEVQPAPVYWELSGQLIAQTFKLQPGARIGSVEISDDHNKLTQPSP